MASVALTISLTTNSKVRCDVNVERDESGRQRWRRFGWSIGGLKFGPFPGERAALTSGAWLYYHPKSELYLVDDRQDNIYATAWQVPSDFLIAATCGNSLNCAGEFWHDGGYQKTDWSFWFGCA